jgi:sarcosine oxidase
MADIESYDIVVVGLGAHGSSALWHLSKTGRKIAGIDRFHPPHQYGSSHGESRIIRQAYHENPLYVPLVQAAYPLWAELGALAGTPLFQKTGGLLLGGTDADVVSGARLSAETHGIPYDYLDATAIRKRFPAFRPTADVVGILEHEAGILFPEAAITAFLGQAAAGGATLRTGEQVTTITPLQEGIELTTTKRRYRTQKLIVSAGAWLNTLFPELDLPLTIRRQVLFWFGDAAASPGAAAQPHHRASDPGRFHPRSMPVFIWEYQKNKLFYGIPDLGHGLKLGGHHDGHPVNPDELTQQVDITEIEDMQKIAANHLSIDPVFQKSCVCMYTNTPDGDFIIDLHPQHPDIVIASPCSGHGFKFSAIIGRLLADLALERPTGFDLTPFSIHRKTITG